MTLSRLVLLLSLACVPTPVYDLQDHTGHSHESKDPASGQGTKISGPSYPLSTCVVDGKLLPTNGKAIELVHGGRIVRLCSDGCAITFKKDPSPSLEKLDQAVISAQKGNYPLTTCPVSGKTLGAMGEPMDLVVGNRLVRLCCGGCANGVRKNAAAAIDKIDRAVVSAQAKAYPLSTCVVSGKPLGAMGKPIDYVHGTTLVRFCCNGCVKTFEKSAADYLLKLDTSTMSRPASRKADPDSTPHDPPHKHVEGKDHNNHGSK